MHPMLKLQLEQLTFRLADMHIAGYKGGQWTWKRKHFFAPAKKEKLTLVNAMNQSPDAEVDSLTAGYCLAILACNDLCWRAYNSGNERLSRFWADHQYALRDHALDTLPEGEVSKLLTFID